MHVYMSTHANIVTYLLVLHNQVFLLEIASVLMSYLYRNNFVFEILLIVNFLYFANLNLSYKVVLI